ncbi:proteasome activator pa28 REG alpha beta subunit [Hymenopellis radicata]|nr:proteasome activator pa28 REG alpha beta subunit [Hymenopellis radicata]
METELAKKIEAFRVEVSQKAEHIVFSVFPSKIIELQELITSTASANSPFHPSNISTTDTSVYSPSQPNSDEPATRKRRLENGVDEQGVRFTGKVASNKSISALHDTVKRECEQLAANVDAVKVWITLTMPKIEDGDNFGVQVQEECLSELHRAQESAYNIRDVARQDYITRAKLCSKLLKYPNVEDYIIALKEHDGKQVFYARQHIIDVRNLYASLMDLLQKNISKIRSPKANNSGGMY